MKPISVLLVDDNPAFLRIVTRFLQEHDDVVVAGAAGGGEEALVLLDELGITYPAGTTADVTVMRDYKVLGTPATYFLKPNGEIIQQWNGFLTGDQLNGHIEALLEASSSS